MLNCMICDYISTDNTTIYKKFPGKNHHITSQNLGNTTLTARKKEKKEGRRGEGRGGNGKEGKRREEDRPQKLVI